MAINLNKLKTSGRLVFIFLQTHTPHNTYTQTHAQRKQEKTQGRRKETTKMEKEGEFFCSDSLVEQYNS